jgi:hypothetical protein
MANFNIDPDRFAALARTSGGADLLADDALLLAREGHLNVHWAPFDHMPATARLVIVGITPGRQQAMNALLAFAQALRSGRSPQEALRQAKLTGSFSGPLCANLVRMLDFIGLPKVLGVPSCATLFDAAHEQVHFTSALRYPVFRDGANYNGNPDPLRTPLLRGMIETFLAEEARAFPDAFWLPLGPKPIAALQHLVSLGMLEADRVLAGMPHPSGASGERIKFFLGEKARTALSIKTRPDLIERARDRLLTQVARLRSA